MKNEKNSIIFTFQFNEKNYYKGFLGIVNHYDDVNIENIIKVFNKKLSQLNYKLETEESWLHSEWSHNIEKVSDFVEYIHFNENAEKEFSNQIINLINIFEEDSKLMTEINSYLNEKDEN